MATVFLRVNVNGGEVLIDRFKEAHIKLQESPVIVRGRLVSNNDEWAGVFGHNRFREAVSDFYHVFPAVLAHPPTVFWVMDSESRVHYIRYYFEDEGFSPHAVIIREDNIRMGVTAVLHPIHPLRYFDEESIFAMASFILD